jgi:hypothetical protein
MAFDNTGHGGVAFLQFDSHRSKEKIIYNLSFENAAEVYGRPS